MKDPEVAGVHEWKFIKPSAGQSMRNIYATVASTFFESYEYLKGVIEKIQKLCNVLDKLTPVK